MLKSKEELGEIVSQFKAKIDKIHGEFDMTKKTVGDAVDYFNGVWPDEKVETLVTTGTKWNGAKHLTGHVEPLNCRGAKHVIGENSWVELCTRAEFDAEVERRNKEDQLVKSYDDMQGKQPKPEAGLTCSMLLAFTEYESVTITYVGDGVFCYRNNRNGEEYTGDLGQAAFRPIKTKEEREVDAAVADMEHRIESATGEPANSTHLSILAKTGYRLNKP